MARSVPFVRSTSATDARSRRCAPTTLSPGRCAGSRNILFEVAPHPFASALDLVPSVDVEHVTTSRPQDLPNGVRFFREWNILGKSGDVSVRFDLSFEDAYSESFVHVRGSTGSVVLDFVHNSVVVNTRSFAPEYVELAEQGLHSASAYARGAVGTLLETMAGRSVRRVRRPYEQSIDRTVAQFYADRQRRVLDRRLGPDLALRVVELGEAVAEAARLPETAQPDPVAQVRATGPAPDPTRPRALVLGGTGFIGTALVRRLATQGCTPASSPGVRSRRAPVRRPSECRRGAGATSSGPTNSSRTWPTSTSCTTWPSPSRARGGRPSTRGRTDEAVHRSVCRRARRSIRHASSIAIFDAGDASRPITEATPASPGVVATSNYARAKAEIEAYLLERHPRRRVSRRHHPAGHRARGRLGSRPRRHCRVATSERGTPFRQWAAQTSHRSRRRRRRRLRQGARSTRDRGALLQPVEPRVHHGRGISRRGRPGVGESDPAQAAVARTMYASQVAKWLVKKAVGRKDPLPRWADCNGRSFASPFDCSVTEAALDWHPESDRSVLLSRGVTEPAEAFIR